jgi:hypothetical protein
MRSGPLAVRGARAAFNTAWGGTGLQPAKEGKMPRQTPVRLLSSSLLVTLGVLLGLGLAPRHLGAHDATGGAANTANVLIESSTTFQALVEVGFDFSAFPHPHHCGVMASAQAQNPGDATVRNRYIFVLSLDDPTPAPNHGSTRTIDFNDNAVVADTDLREVSSTFFFAEVPPGEHTIRWMAKKVGADDAPMTVQDSSLLIICTRSQLQ